MRDEKGDEVRHQRFALSVQGAFEQQRPQRGQLRERERESGRERERESGGEREREKERERDSETERETHR